VEAVGELGLREAGGLEQLAAAGGLEVSDGGGDLLEALPDLGGAGLAAWGGELALLGLLGRPLGDRARDGHERRRGGGGVELAGELLYLVEDLPAALEALEVLVEPLPVVL
jgi:hypothetical protein